MKAQEANDLLDHGNRLALAYERSGKIPTSTASLANKVPEDPFWDLPPSHWQPFLVLGAARGPGPATLPAEEGMGRKRSALCLKIEMAQVASQETCWRQYKRVLLSVDRDQQYKETWLPTVSSLSYDSMISGTRRVEQGAKGLAGMNGRVSPKSA